MKSLIICGSGYSVRKGIKQGLWERIKGNDIWSLNFAFLSMPYIPTAQVWGDASVFYKHESDILTMHKEGCKLYAKDVEDYSKRDKEKIEVFKTDDFKIHKRGKKIFAGRMGLCGVFALSLAIRKGYTDIFLLGYDFGSPTLRTKKTHFYQDTLPNVNVGAVGHPTIYIGTKSKPRDEVYDFDKFLEHDVMIHNVSEISNIECFIKMSWKAFFERVSK